MIWYDIEVISSIAHAPPLEDRLEHVHFEPRVGGESATFLNGIARPLNESSATHSQERT